ncbi:hypothetical protein DFQ04_2829 [Algoriphagus boseongensis]|uniref:Collagen triple helix repeat protein n=2 Tax=Algoriphagus boseongensis TaxID=1442587 RepID=A0A4R6T2J4_9BACT|nr:hypothetical protein DFQ04_2829 [Algoriphagus boseongensis]
MIPAVEKEQTIPTMNRYLSIFALIGLLAFQACEGPIGPPGPQGPEGEPGVTIVGEAFEVEVDFTSQNGYESIFDFDPAIVQSDVVLAFIQWETTSSNQPVWRALPQNVFFNNGVLVYNYDFTRTDFRLFLDGAIDFSSLGPDWTQNQVFRLIVVPADFAGGRIDWTDYEGVTRLLGIEEKDFIKLGTKK